MKLRILLFTITIALHYGMNAQSAMLVGNFGYKAGPTFYKGFSRLATNYNLTNPNNKTPLSKMGMSTGSWYSVDVVTMGMYLSFYHHNTTAKAISEISDYKTRQFELNYKVWGVDFGGGYLKDNIGLVGYAGIYFGMANITASYKYFDGYKSIGAEGSNGIYHGFGFSGSVGVKTFYMYKMIGLTAGIRWTPIGGASLGYSDYNIGGGTSLSENWGGFGTPKNLQPSFSTLSLDLGIAIKVKAY
jgi:hypothetical protein